MSRRSRNLPVTVVDNTGAPAIVQGPMTYVATDDMARLRAEYFALCEANPLDSRDARDRLHDYFPTQKADQVIRLMDSNPAFESWFQATHEFNSRIKYLADKALSALEHILQNEHPQAQSARVKAAQFVVAMAGQKPKDPDEAGKNLHSALKGLNKAQLEAMMTDGTKIKASVERPTTLDLSKDDYDGD
jgi:pantoate kinase